MVLAYEEIVAGGRQRLEGMIRCGGLHGSNLTLITTMSQQVHKPHGKWDLDCLFDARGEQAMKELLRYKGMGPKCAFVVMSWCLKRKPFTVDTHVFRIAGLWGWIPEITTREKAQAHLDATVPKKLKFHLLFLLIAHGRTWHITRSGQPHLPSFANLASAASSTRQKVFEMYKDMAKMGVLPGPNVEAARPVI